MGLVWEHSRWGPPIQGLLQSEYKGSARSIFRGTGCLKAAQGPGAMGHSNPS